MAADATGHKCVLKEATFRAGPDRAATEAIQVGDPHAHPPEVVPLEEVPLVKRGRARPVTTGIGERIKEAKAARAREEEERAEAEVLRAISNPTMRVVEPSKRAKPLRSAEEIQESLAGLAADVLDRIAAAERGFNRCTNKLKGTVVHVLREATHTAYVIMELIAPCRALRVARHCPPPPLEYSREEEMRVLRSENATLKMQLEGLKAELGRVSKVLAELTQAGPRRGSPKVAR